MSEITITAGVLIVTAVVIILTTISLVIATKVFSRSRLPDSGCSGGVVPIIPDTSSSSYSGSWKYDVFLSFKGEDTRKTFVDHLYSALQQHGILTYKDDVTLDRGDTIRPSLLKAIEESQILVIIFSVKYADSSWCLDELTHIMKCGDKVTGQIVLPIFYHVDPSDVRKQKGQFGKAFAKHKLSKNKKEKVESWKKALVDASNIAGWEPKHVANGHEAKGIQEIVGSILDKLTSLNPVVDDENLVGMGIRLKQLKSQLRIESGGVRMVGIWGLGGIGKTTLATSLYLQISPNFDGCCFLGNVREESSQHGLPSLQEKILFAVFNKKNEVQSVELGKHTIKHMLSRRNVLLVLDDVDHLDQLKALAGCRSWFGDGSRIVITTRDRHLLTTHKVDAVSPISLLSHEEAIRLFNKHAYNEDNPLQDYEMLSQKIVSYAAGLPLALIVLGSFLNDKDKDEWISTLARLKDHPEMDIMEKLKISYDGLKHVEKELFLDIACFFRRTMLKDFAMEILDACGFYPAIGVKVLIQKALITVSKDGELDMHDLVQEMGHYIVRGKHPNSPEKHSRLWRKEDVEDICSRNATLENDKIEAIDLKDRQILHNPFSSFMMLVSNINKVRFLRVTTHGSNIGYEGPRFLSNELRYIDWDGYPASPLPESFQPTKLAVLKMERSLQKELWKGYKYLPCLKVLQLSWMEELARTPDFGGLPCLQKLILKRCESLEEIHPSFGNHSSLVSVDVSWCGKLKRFPSIVGMEKLEILRISNCKALVEFPKIEAKMDNLVELSLERVGIEVLPSSVGEYCTNLISLELGCENLKSIEGNFHALKCLKKFKLSDPPFGKFKFDILSHLPRSLRKLNLNSCGLKDGEIPTEIGELSNLQELDLRSNDFTRLDFSLSRLTRLKLLYLSWCSNLVELPELPSSLAVLEAVGCGSLEAIIRDDIHINCKWLSDVSIWGGINSKWLYQLIIKGGGNNMIGGERLLETMLQGKAIESGCISLLLRGLEIARGFEPRLVERGRCRMQLPENWFHDFSGFLFCTASGQKYSPNISMKHENLEGDFQDDVYYWEEGVDDDTQKYTWVGYIPFSLLKHTSWWDPTSTAVEIDMRHYESTDGFGFKLIPKTRETSMTDSSSFDYDVVSDDYTCPLEILHDSKYAFKFYIKHYIKHY